MPDVLTVVLVHGWSVHHTSTYGGLPARLKREAQMHSGQALDVREIWLSKYVSFRDEVRLEDISKGMEAEVENVLGDLLKANKRFAVITHSTGGPVVRDWMFRYYVLEDQPIPVSHLIMLAPANFGSALARLGKSRLSRIKTWFQGVEPGQGVLDWLELGSPEAWDLNADWLDLPGDFAEKTPPTFLFSLTGQTINRKLYDHLNPYTGEIGSDGVVRVPSANLNFRRVVLSQDAEVLDPDIVTPSPLRIEPSLTATSDPMAFGLLPGVAHSGDEIGIMRSVKDNDRPHPTVEAITSCLAVASKADYRKEIDNLRRKTETTMEEEQVETRREFLSTRHFIHDPFSMLILRVVDDSGYELTDFDFRLLGEGNNPNMLPTGAIVDRQRNQRAPNTITFFINHALMKGCEAIYDSSDSDREKIRPFQPGVGSIGLEITPRPTDGFVHYQPAVLPADRQHVDLLFMEHGTTMLEIVLHRVVRRGVFQLTNSLTPKDFKKQDPGESIG